MQDLSVFLCCCRSRLFLITIIHSYCACFVKNYFHQICSYYHSGSANRKEKKMITNLHRSVIRCDAVYWLKLVRYPITHLKIVFFLQYEIGCRRLQHCAVWWGEITGALSRMLLLLQNWVAHTKTLWFYHFLICEMLYFQLQQASSSARTAYFCEQKPKQAVAWLRIARIKAVLPPVSKHHWVCISSKTGSLKEGIPDICPFLQ